MAATRQKRNEALAKSKQEKCACKKKWVRLKQYWYKNGIIYCSIAVTLEPVARVPIKPREINDLGQCSKHE